jgi:hypothetical protein
MNAYYRGHHDGEFYKCGVKYPVLAIADYKFKIRDEKGVERWIFKVNKFFLLLTY